MKRCLLHLLMHNWPVNVVNVWRTKLRRPKV